MVKNINKTTQLITHEALESFLKNGGKEIERPVPPPAATRLLEKAGHLISGSALGLPYDSGTPLDKTTINKVGGYPTPFAGLLTQADILHSELNLAVLMGKWFYYNYNPLKEDATQIITNRKVCQLSKKIYFNPFDRDVFVIARTTGNLPVNPVTTIFRGWDRCNIQIAGVQADVSSSLGYLKSDGRLAGDTAEDIVIRSITRQLGNDPQDIYRHNFHQDCIVKIPAGVSELVYHAELLGQAFTSNDINTLLENRIVMQYALAMLDLRKEVTYIDDPIIINPLSGDIWPPPGGVKLQVYLEFREVEHVDGL